MFNESLVEKRVKFSVERLSNKIPICAELRRFLLWGKLLYLYIAHSYPPTYGNMSIRYKKGMLITNSGADLSNLTVSDFSYVTDVKVDDMIVFYHSGDGYVPSSETILHWRIYEQIKDIRAIIHIHADSILVKAGLLEIPLTRNHAPHGSLPLVREVEDILKDSENIKIIGLQGHGLFSLGKSVYEAAWSLVEAQARALDLSAEY